tara:strand:+ start:64 stop:426 length:363 start_codon:yes stop_codon:yes gene_type:complete
MACTRNKNTHCDYLLEQRKNRLINDYSLFENGSSGRAHCLTIPTLGYNPSHLPREVLSSNSIDIESKLKGINSCNLVTPQQEITPQLKDLCFRDFFEVNRQILIPEPLIIENNQRPFIIP